MHFMNTDPPPAPLHMLSLPPLFPLFVTTSITLSFYNYEAKVLLHIRMPEFETFELLHLLLGVPLRSFTHSFTHKHHTQQLCY